MIARLTIITEYNVVHLNIYPDKRIVVHDVLYRVKMSDVIEQHDQDIGH